MNIGSRALDILIALITRPGELATKRELMSIVWPDTVVVEANLTVNIVALRRALRDGQNGNRYIPNIPGRGYSFVAPVEFADEIKSSELPTSLRAADAVAIHASELDFEPFGKFHPVNRLKGAPTRRARAHTLRPPQRILIFCSFMRFSGRNGRFPAFAFAEFCQDLLGFIRAETADEVRGFDDNEIDTRISEGAE